MGVKPFIPPTQVAAVSFDGLLLIQLWQAGVEYEVSLEIMRNAFFLQQGGVERQRAIELARQAA